MIYSKKISSLEKRCRYAVPARTVTKNPGHSGYSAHENSALGEQLGYTCTAY